MKRASGFSRLCKAPCVAALLLLAASCGNGKALKDGVYQGKSGPDDRGAWGEVTLTIKDGKAGACTFVTRQKDGTVKGKEYGMINGEISSADYYEKAQLAVRAMDAYAAQFVETGSIQAVEAVSGATIAYNQFAEAASEALDAARKRSGP
ncbi:MAG: FMN-binding protein [Spirochaetaceae bacterium]|jgi:major membrane immunogen (membrane-anchored lipoprotein)|nr:FMN-binding protein [Spirochaetaceae bacterium]